MALDWSGNSNAHTMRLNILLIYIYTYIYTSLINTYNNLVDSSVPIQHVDFKTSYKTNVTHKKQEWHCSGRVPLKRLHT